MRELQDIVAAFDALAAEGKPSALATVVGVEGSAYRRPGARMLVAEDGRTWGGVSGGCLERDVADRARGVIAAGRAHLQRYDTTDDELIARGVSTGCGGTIDVLIEPLSGESPGIVPSLRGLLADACPQQVFTVIHATGPWRLHAGRSYTLSETPSDPASCLPVDAGLLHEVACVFAGAVHRTARATVRRSQATAEVFAERMSPPPRLVLVGGGPDVVPVMAIAKTLGWRVAVVAARPGLQVLPRFAAADERYVTGADAPLDGVPLGPDDAVVVMTHNLARDAAVLAALPARPRYLGLLGPRHRTERAVAALPAGHPGRMLHSPVGLDIGSDTPEEIALSIVAEVQAVLRRADARPLSAKPAGKDAAFTDVPCPA